MRATGRRSTSAPVTNSIASGTPCTATGSRAPAVTASHVDTSGEHQRARQRDGRQHLDDLADPQVAREHVGDGFPDLRPSV